MSLAAHSGVVLQHALQHLQTDDLDFQVRSSLEALSILGRKASSMGTRSAGFQNHIYLQSHGGITFFLTRFQVCA